MGEQAVRYFVGVAHGTSAARLTTSEKMSVAKASAFRQLNWCCFAIDSPCAFLS